MNQPKNIEQIQELTRILDATLALVNPEVCQQEQMQKQS